MKKPTNILAGPIERPQPKKKLAAILAREIMKLHDDNQLEARCRRMLELGATHEALLLYGEQMCDKISAELIRGALQRITRRTSR